MIKAKKKFGQNFLKDELVKQQIIQAIPKDLKAKLIEIGPGLGDLTAPILKSGFKLTSFEIDDSLIPILNERFNKEILSGDFTLINADVMNVKISDEPYFICANLPYYISSQIIINALFDDNCIGMLVMIQKELADRFFGIDYCALSVITDLLCDKVNVCEVPPSAFTPMPKVNSSVIKLIKKPNLLDKKDLKAFNSFIKIAFNQPRKKMLSSFSNKTKVKQALDKLEIDENKRAHEISVKSFLELFKLLKDENEY
ncbi:16S rRNA (adenine(1518)-N(6)/adenine(1519)-N(6))-dimethyltransferase RsmA [Campylobacter sp. RM9333]|uniref:16S rRNA (adenine(1518)-N(6)/adenine(1519)-N(6))- dimethyltransferase RsmA n=1 Tax=unclassified Campylobacter TaxID=2593542 RepID=UPI001BD9AD6E|nr:16S rRNA (adenine(1518)-N(6)/adenine(1519)-N(6))-dimethyltransferase RsmA [Campylobacter sp. 2018MI01]MBT0878842.1 16S rRNA (adenine(1518)-N(6)/adenine(1519)-N(6))-dimethyltransferase RsmA [Campylobacter sp. 2018MI01]MBZ7992958.1 16S rRNA (adenine(1518)-N(6)/adenine(1519)-N(6))-dimethyltransferase RsmA [Campylobacter sp. RM9333]